ncbi:MAG: hypothetical protein NVS1B10_06670 [Candidatus Saccharimonadales bacterium]
MNQPSKSLALALQVRKAAKHGFKAAAPIETVEAQKPIDTELALDAEQAPEAEVRSNEPAISAIASIVRKHRMGNLK